MTDAIQVLLYQQCSEMVYDKVSAAEHVKNVLLIIAILPHLFEQNALAHLKVFRFSPVPSRSGCTNVRKSRL